MNSKLSVSLSSDSVITTSEAVYLEQAEVVEPLTIQDLSEMWVVARSGKSARNHKATDQYIKISEDSVTFDIEFYAWPVPLDLSYELSTTLGEVSVPEEVEREREKSVVFGLSKQVSMERTVSDLTYKWETPLIDEFGTVHSALPITVAESHLSIAEPYFGVARVKYLEYGQKYAVRSTIKTVDEDGNSITVDNIDITITAVWVDSEGNTQTETLKLEIPESVLAAFKMCGGRPNMICYNCPDDFLMEVYYNDCDGKIIGTNRVDLSEGGQWCLPGSGD